MESYLVTSEDGGLNTPARIKNDKESEIFSWKSANHCQSMLTGLNTLRKKNLLFDVTLVTDGCCFKAHKVVLASCSDYFRAMLTTEMRERSQEVIRLHGVSAVGMQEILDFAYSSSLTVSLENVQHVLGAASHVGVTPVVEACAQFMYEHLQLENCVDIAVIADMYSLTSLSNKVQCFMAKNLERLACLHEFQLLSMPQLKTLLNSSYTVQCLEIEIFKAVLLWLSYDTPVRACHATDLLSLVQFQQIPSHESKKIMESHSYKVISSEFLKVHSIIMHAIDNEERNPSNLHLQIPGVVNLRGFEKTIVKVGGFTSSIGITNDLTYYQNSSQQWRGLTEVPHVHQANFGCAVLNNILYVVGGCFNQSLEENVHPFGFKYDVQTNEWSIIAPMMIERCGFYLASAGSKLYAIGGTDDHEDVPTPPCECFDPETNTWSEVAVPPGVSRQHAGVSHNTKIYITGGLDWDTVLSSLWCYDIEQDEWTVLQNMLTPRADHCIGCHEDKLYIFGGWNNIANGRVTLSSIDCYDINTNQWHTISHMPTPRYNAALALVGSCFHFIGGVEHSAYSGASSAIDILDMDNITWKKDNYTESIWEHQCCILHVPIYR